MQAHSEVPETEDSDHDIYRGDRQHRPPDVHSITSTSTSTSASTSIPRIGALATVLEQAISRWARRNSSGSSSTSTASSYSNSSAYPHTRRHGKRRKTRSTSISTSIASERAISARLRARQEARLVPREFVLYLPPEMTLGGRHPSASHTSQDIFRGSSLPLVLSALENGLKKTAKRKGKKAVRPTDPSLPSHNIGISPDFPQPHSRPLSFVDVAETGQSKDKQKAVMRNGPTLMRSRIVGRAPNAWWLDVASPTWDDMRTIGKLLHLHPLTLEDILQRDTREKLEWFPKLGYQFIVFRAMESAYTREQRNVIIDQGDGGPIGEANMYLVIFRGGICTFHFTDISEHIERVRTRVRLLQDSVVMSSDWIAHGLLDSVVDSFFPILREVKKDVAAIETILFGNGELTETTFSAGSGSFDAERSTGTVAEKEEEASSPCSQIEKVEATPEVVGPRFSMPRLTMPLVFRRLKRRAKHFLQDVFSTSKTRNTSVRAATSITFRRMARMRRLVTSLTRLLASKSELVSQIRKRYLSNGKVVHDESVEIAMYMGDIQDHILALQQILSHYELILSESYPAYLSKLRTIVSNTNNSSDKAVLALSLVSMGALVPGPIIGIFSMNIHIPRNTIDNPKPSGGYYWFGIVLVLVLAVECSFATLVRYWWIRSKRRHKPML